MNENNITPLNTFKAYQEILNVRTGTSITNLGNRVTNNENNIITLNTFKGDQEIINTNNTSAFTSLGARTFNLESVNSEFRIGNLEVADGVHLNRIEALEAKTIIGASNMTITGSGSNIIIDTKQNIKVTDTPTFVNVISGAPTLDTHLTNKLYCDRYFSSANYNALNLIRKWQPYLVYHGKYQVINSNSLGGEANFWCIGDTCYANFRIDTGTVTAPSGTLGAGLAEKLRLSLPLEVASIVNNESYSLVSNNTSSSSIASSWACDGCILNFLRIKSVQLRSADMTVGRGLHCLILRKEMDLSTGIQYSITGNDINGRRLVLETSIAYKCKFPYVAYVPTNYGLTL